MVESFLLVRAVHLAATALAAGTAAFIVLVAQPSLRDAKDIAAAELAVLRRQWRWLIWISLAVAIVSGAGWLVLLAADILGESIFQVCLHGGVVSVLLETRFGIVWALRLVLALLMAVLLLRPSLRLPLLLAAAGLIGSLAFVGHAGATPGASGEAHLASDILHLLATGAWLGGLPALALLLERMRHLPEKSWSTLAAGAVRRFSILGIAAVGTLLATGLVNCWNLLSGPSDLIATDYGRLVLLKIILFAIIVGIAAVNRFHLLPRLMTGGVIRSLERNAIAEAGLGLCVLAVVATIGTMPPSVHGHRQVASTKIPADAAFVHIHSEKGMADVTISPGRPGTARATIRLWCEDLTPLAAQRVTIALTAPAAGSTPMSYVMAQDADGVWKSDLITLSQAGNWIVVVTTQIRPSDQLVLDGPIVIAPAQ